MEIKNFYKTQTKVSDGFKAVFSLGVLDKDVINSYKENSIVKFIFFDGKHSDISFNPDVHEIHKLRSVYRGNTFTRLPLVFIKDEDGEHVNGFTINEETQEPDGYVLASKRDVWDEYKEIRRESREVREEFAKILCRRKLAEYNDLLKGLIYKAKVTSLDDTKVYFDDYYIGDIDELLEGVKLENAGTKNV